MKQISSLLLLVAPLIAGSLLPTGTVYGQSSDYYELVQNLNRAQVYSASAVIPGEDGGGQVGISFRVPHALLYFVQADGAGDDSAYRADVEVEVNVYQDGDRVAQKVWQRTPVVADYESAEAQFEGSRGTVWFNLAPGEYQYRVNVRDVISEQTARTQAQDVTVPVPGEVGFSGTILAKSVDADGRRRTVDMFSLSGDVAYGRDAWAVVPIVLPPTASADSLQLMTALRGVEESRDARLMRERRSHVVRPRVDDLVSDLSNAGSVLRSDTLRGSVLMPVANVDMSEADSGRVMFEAPADSQKTSRYLLIIDLDGRELENEHFTFNLSLEGPSGEIARHSTAFASYWREKPFSLYDLDLAVEHLTFMTDADLVDRIDDGSAGQREQKFDEFWKQRDPTPETPYNELMAEYYRRVDHAADEFRTDLKPIRAFDRGGGSVPDGLGSDRARIYIVHGPPTSKERQNPRRGLVREKWNYDDGRTFIFEALSKFDPFRLVERYKYAGR